MFSHAGICGYVGLEYKAPNMRMISFACSVYCLGGCSVKNV